MVELEWLEHHHHLHIEEMRLELVDLTHGSGGKDNGNVLGLRAHLDHLQQCPAGILVVPHIVKDDQIRLEFADSVEILVHIGLGRDTIALLFKQFAKELEDLIGIVDAKDVMLVTLG